MRFTIHLFYILNIVHMGHGEYYITVRARRPRRKGQSGSASVNGSSRDTKREVKLRARCPPRRRRRVSCDVGGTGSRHTGAVTGRPTRRGERERQGEGGGVPGVSQAKGRQSGRQAVRLAEGRDGTCRGAGTGSGVGTRRFFRAKKIRMLFTSLFPRTESIAHGVLCVARWDGILCRWRCPHSA